MTQECISPQPVQSRNPTLKPLHLHTDAGCCRLFQTYFPRSHRLKDDCESFTWQPWNLGFIWLPNGRTKQFSSAARASHYEQYNNMTPLLVFMNTVQKRYVHFIILFSASLSYQSEKWNAAKQIVSSLFSAALDLPSSPLRDTIQTLWTFTDMIFCCQSIKASNTHWHGRICRTSLIFISVDINRLSLRSPRQEFSAAKLN